MENRAKQDLIEPALTPSLDLARSQRPIVLNPLYLVPKLCLPQHDRPHRRGHAFLVVSRWPGVPGYETGYRSRPKEEQRWRQRQRQGERQKKDQIPTRLEAQPQLTLLKQAYCFDVFLLLHHHYHFLLNRRRFGSHYCRLGPCSCACA